MLIPDLDDYKEFKRKENNHQFLPTVWVEDKEFYNVAQTLGKTLYHRKILTYYEAVNKELLKTAFLQFQEEGIIVRRQTQVTRSSPSTISLNRDWLCSTTQYEPIRAIITAETKNNNVSDYLRHNDIIPCGKLYDFSELISESRHKTLRHHDMAINLKGLDMHILRLCSNSGKVHLSSRRIQTLELMSATDVEPLITISKPHKRPDVLSKL